MAADRDAPSGRRRTAALLLLVVLSLVALQSVRMGAAGALVHLAEVEIDEWQQSGQPAGVERLNRIAAQLKTSLSIASDNPWALEKLGALKLATLRTHRERAVAAAETRDARDRFRAALRARPASPYLWAGLARAKLHLDELDGELMAAMRHADALGPWEPAVQENLLFIGLAVWGRLDADLRAARADSIRRAASRNDRKTFQIVKQFRRLDLVCGLPEYNSVAGADCRQVKEAAKTRRPVPGR